MDEHYDLKEAGIKLQEQVAIIEEQAAAGNAGIQMANVQTVNYQVLGYGQPPCWRLAEIPTDESSEVDQIVLRVQGIITDKILPPISRPLSTHAADRMRQHLRQAVTITGLGLPFFQSAIETIEQIHLAFSNAFPVDVVEPWEPAYFKGHHAIDAHSRYFTKSYLVPDQERYPFDHMTDPNGVLAAMQDNDYVHIADNHVDYLGPMVMAGQRKIGPVNPATFRPGDIVELCISFAAFPSAHQRVKMIPVLQSIRMLDNSGRNSAVVLAMHSRYKQNVKFILPKRKAMYTEEEVQQIEGRIAKMRVDE